MNDYSTLELTLRDILRVISPLEEDWAKRFQFINELRAVVESVESLRGATVEPYGSFVSNLFTRWGDLDISIELPNGSFISSAGKKLKQTLLGDLQKALRRRGGWYKLQFIANARVPILKFESNYLNISCDVSINNLNGQMKSKLLFWINEIDGRFRNMVLLVKEWAKTHGINDSKSGTLNSYSLSMLIIFHFQTCVPPLLPPLKEIYPGNIVDDLIAQSSLLKASILVVGAGGLGSPALLYLAACGVGRLGIVDHDVVELNNLHRQIIHTEAYIGQSKVESAAAACHSINSTIQIVEHKEALRTSNALEILSKYDIVIDATDNAPSRYLISDCCVVLGKPLVSGAAIGLEGQLTVYNYNGGPCYRCLFPTPPPTTACQRCSDSGVLGIVPGIIGCHQALEAIKIASDVGEPLSRRMLLFDALTAQIRIVKIRGRSSQCEVCGENATFTEKQFQEFDYEKFTQSPLSMTPLKLDLLPTEARISSKEYKERVVRGEPHALVDVRPAHHFKIASLPNSMNVPLSSLEARLPEISSALKREEEHASAASLYVVCRRGNDSQRAVDYLHKMGFTSAKDIIGGLESWARDVDPNFPTY